jgi:hypothetical protein
MHNLEPFFNWDRYYDSSEDEYSPFYGKEYNYDLYTDAIYNYYIAPGWDYMGSETLYIKILFADYELGYAIIEFIGEWNDAISNDIMHLKRNVIDHLTTYGIDKFILIGENVFNFHGSDDCYYEEWFEEVEDGWIAAVNFRDFIHAEWQKYYIDTYINFGGNLEIWNWRTLTPKQFCELVNRLITRRLALPE